MIVATLIQQVIDPSAQESALVTIFAILGLSALQRVARFIHDLLYFFVGHRITSFVSGKYTAPARFNLYV